MLRFRCSHDAALPGSPYLGLSAQHGCPYAGDNACRDAPALILYKSI
jgi:hypothetical protein